MTITFPDVSHYQDPLSLSGAVAVIAKATQGTSFRDPAYAGFRAQAASLRIPFAGYHWVDTSDLALQAANAYAVLGNTPAMWDAEADGSTVSRLVDLTAKFRALGGNPRLVYLPHWWWQNHLGSPDLRPLINAGLKLVSSNYPSSGYSETGPGWDAYGGVTPTIWQYTSTQLFNGKKVDFNAFKGTVFDLANLFGGSMTLTPDDVTAVARAVWNYQIVSPNGVDKYSSNGSQIDGTKAARNVNEKLAPAISAKLDSALTKLDTLTAPAAVDAATIVAAMQDPAVLAAIAKAVLDEEHKRSAE